MYRKLIVVVAACAAAGAAVAGVAGNAGTGLSATLETAVQCLPAGGATATMEGVLATTGSTDSVEIAVSVDAGAPAVAGLIAPQDFAHAGRVKTAPYSLPVALSAGSHLVRVCFTQSGAAGRPSKAVCVETPVDVVCNASGCSDGQREGFTDLAAYPGIAGCSGGWSVPGIMIDNPGAAPACPGIATFDTVVPACSRRAGNNSSNPSGAGCNVADLCAAGWHVCATAADVAASSPTGCVGVAAPGAEPLFFATRQSSTGCGVAATGLSTDGAVCNAGSCAAGCAQTAAISNDVFGCGNYGEPIGNWGQVAVDAGQPLNFFSHDSCTALGPPWACSGEGVCEAYVLTKAAADKGGVLCCRDRP
jgi:hypothetical protein